MKRYINEIVILLIQLFMFYIYPIYAGPIDPMGMVFFIWLSVLILSIIIGSISKEKIKYFYPIIISILFIPSVFIYYNESALVHSLWYLLISYIGLTFGTVIYKLIHRNKNESKGEK